MLSILPYILKKEGWTVSKEIIDIDIINEEKPKSKRGRKPKDKSNEVALTKEEKKKKLTSKK